MRIEIKTYTSMEVSGAKFNKSNYLLFDNLVTQGIEIEFESRVVKITEKNNHYRHECYEFIDK